MGYMVAVQIPASGDKEYFAIYREGDKLDVVSRDGSLASPPEVMGNGSNLDDVAAATTISAWFSMLGGNDGWKIAIRWKDGAGHWDITSPQGETATSGIDDILDYVTPKTAGDDSSDLSQAKQDFRTNGAAAIKEWRRLMQGHELHLLMGEGFPDA